jgi:hypothetical protein
MSDNRNTTNYIEKFKKFRSLLIFFVGARLFSAVLMNRLVLPISALAVKNPHVFTIATCVLLTIIVSYFIIRRLQRLIMNIFNEKDSLKHFIFRAFIARLKKSLYISAIYIISCIILFSIFIFLSYNNQIISDLLK